MSAESGQEQASPPGASLSDILDVTVDGDVSRNQVEEARRRFTSLERYMRHPPEGARLTLRRGAKSASNREYVADASVLFEGRVFAAHSAAPKPDKAVDAAVDRLRRQLRRVVGAEVAQRNEPAAIRAALESLDPDLAYRPVPGLKPADEREVLYRPSPADKPLETLDAVAYLIDLDLEFLLFRHARVWEEVVVYRREDNRIGLVVPPGSELATENDVVVPEPSPHTNPLTVDAARAELEELNRRFVYFVDAADPRGKVIYLRHDGNYGVVEAP